MPLPGELAGPPQCDQVHRTGLLHQLGKIETPMVDYEESRFLPQKCRDFLNARYGKVVVLHGPWCTPAATRWQRTHGHTGMQSCVRTNNAFTGDTPVSLAVPFASAS